MLGKGFGNKGAIGIFVLSIMGVRRGEKIPEKENDSLTMITKSSPCD